MARMFGRTGLPRRATRREPRISADASFSDRLERAARRAENGPSLALGFYEADFVKTRGEYSFLFIFSSF
jgi:hypothetical protein